MTGVFAKAGEAVTTEDGKVICYVKNDLRRGGVLAHDDFHRFAEGEQPWKPMSQIDYRCMRHNPSGNGPQICIEGEWRP